jgi:hypothetical protein
MYSNIDRILMFRQPIRALSPHPHKWTLDAVLDPEVPTVLSMMNTEMWAPWVFPTSYACRHNPLAPVLTENELKSLGGTPTFAATRQAAIVAFMKFLIDTDLWVMSPDGLKTRRHVTRMLDHVRETRDLTYTKIVFDTLLQILAQKATFQHLEAPDMSYAHWFAAAEGVELTKVVVRAHKRAARTGIRLDWSRK